MEYLPTGFGVFIHPSFLSLTLNTCALYSRFCCITKNMRDPHVTNAYSDKCCALYIGAHQHPPPVTELSEGKRMFLLFHYNDVSTSFQLFYCTYISISPISTTAWLKKARLTPTLKLCKYSRTLCPHPLLKTDNWDKFNYDDDYKIDINIDILTK